MATNSRQHTVLSLDLRPYWDASWIEHTRRMDAAPLHAPSAVKAMGMLALERPDAAIIGAVDRWQEVLNIARAACRAVAFVGFAGELTEARVIFGKDVMYVDRHEVNDVESFDAVIRDLLVKVTESEAKG